MKNTTEPFNKWVLGHRHPSRGVACFSVGDRITIQPDNLSPRRQYLAHATGEITAIKGNKASVLLDEPSNKSYKSQTIKIDLCSLKLISAQGSGQDFHMQESLLEDSSCKDSVKLTNSAATDCAIASPVSESTPTCENLRLDQEQQTLSHHPLPVNPSQLKENVWEALTSETVSEQFCDKLDSSNPSLQLSKTCLDCYQPPLFPETNPAHILGRCSGSFMAVGTMRNGLLSEQPSTVLSGQEKGSCLLPRPGALSKSSESSRPPGNTKSEAKAKKLGILQKNEVFNPEWLELQFGLPVGWTSPQEHRAATELLALDEPPSEIVLTPDLQQLPLEESSTSTRSVAKKSDCCYTPLHIVDLVKRVLGEIDLDPCADDGKHIPSQLHYTAKDDGLSKPWHGRIFFNPPYSCPGKWVAWFLQEYAALRVTEAIALLPAATDTNWLSPVLKTQPVCFWKGRIKFLDENYKPMRQGARQSHVLVYWGENWQKFKEVFNSYGFVSVPCQFLEDYSDQQSSRNSTEDYQFLEDKNYSSRKNRRNRGEGSACIYYRTVTKKGKDYCEAYYQYEFWSEGDRLTKSTKYIPKRLLGRVQELEAKKAPVREILAVLGVKL